VLGKLDQLLGKHMSSEHVCQTIKSLRSEIMNQVPPGLTKAESSGDAAAVQENGQARQPVDQEELKSKSCRSELKHRQNNSIPPTTLLLLSINLIGFGFRARG